jgi:site-specific recombinase XerC
VQPSQVERASLAKGRTRRRAPGDRYTPATYRQAIQRACERAYGMADELRDPATPKQKAADTPEKRDARRAARRAWHRKHLWHPHQVRHTFATKIRRDHGIENAKVLLGQTTLTAAQVYAEADSRKAEQIIAEVG